MPDSRNSLVLLGLMLAAVAGAIVARPEAKIADQRPNWTLEAVIPARFGGWREVPLAVTQVVNPQTQQVLDRLYSQVLSRVYVNDAGYRVMLSIAYGSDQRRGLQAHKPEVCYPAQGFLLQQNIAGRVETPFGAIPVRRLYATLQFRHEPITYWFTVGDSVVEGTLQKRLVDLRYGLTGQIPDGLLFRVSSIDYDRARAYRQHDAFVVDLLAALDVRSRRRLSGLQPK